MLLQVCIKVVGEILTSLTPAEKRDIVKIEDGIGRFCEKPMGEKETKLVRRGAGGRGAARRGRARCRQACCWERDVCRCVPSSGTHTRGCGARTCTVDEAWVWRQTSGRRRL